MNPLDLIKSATTEQDTQILKALCAWHQYACQVLWGLHVCIKVSLASSRFRTPQQQEGKYESETCTSITWIGLNCAEFMIMTYPKAASGRTQFLLRYVLGGKDALGTTKTNSSKSNSCHHHRLYSTSSAKNRIFWCSSHWSNQGTKQ